MMRSTDDPAASFPALGETVRTEPRQLPAAGPYQTGAKRFERRFTAAP